MELDNRGAIVSLVKLNVDYLNLKGRINRLDFFVWSGISTSAYCVTLLEYIMLKVEFTNLVVVPWFCVTLLIYLYVMLILCVKRLHDMNLSGWHVIWIWALGSTALAFQTYNPKIAVILAFFNSFSALMLFLVPGSAGANKFGFDN